MLNLALCFSLLDTGEVFKNVRKKYIDVLNILSP